MVPEDTTEPTQGTDAAGTDQGSPSPGDSTGGEDQQQQAVATPDPKPDTSFSDDVVQAQRRVDGARRQWMSKLEKSFRSRGLLADGESISEAGGVDAVLSRAGQGAPTPQTVDPVPATPAPSDDKKVTTVSKQWHDDEMTKIRQKLESQEKSHSSQIQSIKDSMAQQKFIADVAAAASSANLNQSAVLDIVSNPNYRYRGRFDDSGNFYLIDQEGNPAQGPEGPLSPAGVARLIREDDRYSYARTVASHAGVGGGVQTPAGSGSTGGSSTGEMTTENFHKIKDVDEKIAIALQKEFKKNKIHVNEMGTD